MYVNQAPFTSWDVLDPLIIGESIEFVVILALFPKYSPRVLEGSPSFSKGSYDLQESYSKILEGSLGLMRISNWLPLKGSTSLS